MMRRVGSLTIVAVWLSGMNLAASADEGSPADKQWAAWRGPTGNGVAPDATPPAEWSEDKNIRWKVRIPGRGHATPIVWGDTIYIQTAVDSSENGARADADRGDPAPAEGSGPGRRRMRDGNEEGGDDRPMRRERPTGEENASAEQRESGRSQPGDGERPRRGRGRGRGRRAAPKNQFEFQVVALDRKTGKTLWTKTVKEEVPHEGGHPDASQASNSPVADGENVYAYFGSRGLYCLSSGGDVRWGVDLGKMQTRNEFGEGSSPALYEDTLVVNWDHEGDDFIVAFDKNTGKEKWRVSRDEQTTWCTPIIVEVKGKPQVVVTATNFTRAYDLETGKEIWRCKGMTQNVIPTPMVSNGLLFAISGFRGASLQAIEYASAKGDISDSETIAWKYDRDTPYVPSGVLYRNRIYFVENNRPLLTCLDAKTGKPLYPKQRLSGIDMIYSSLVAAEGKVYIVGRNGTTMVLKDGETFEVLATNKLDDGFDASPAIAGEAIFLRGRAHLYCIGEGGSGESE